VIFKLSNQLLCEIYITMVFKIKEFCPLLQNSVEDTQELKIIALLLY